LLSPENVNFVVDAALALFGVSLGLSIQLSYSDLKIFPTMICYRLRKRRRESLSETERRELCGSVAEVVFNSLTIAPLGAFWYYRECVTRLLPNEFWWFMLYLIFGAVVGLLPWVAFLGTRKIVRDP
jgi:hypothetical protein